MEINLIGLVAAVTAFLSIWIGHVSVRKIEAETVKLWKTIVLAIVLGIGLVSASIVLSNRSLSTVCGILGITLLWDAFEIKRQEHRILRGHAPANPNNPRHASILAAPNSKATILDILKRNPIGRVVDPDDASRLITDHRG